MFQFEKITNYQNLTTWKITIFLFYRLENQFEKIIEYFEWQNSFF